MTAAFAPLLKIEELRTWFDTPGGVVKAVDDVSLEVLPGECLGIVGESGSGKSVTFASVIGLVRRPGRIAGGRILFEGVDLVHLPPGAMREIRGRAIAMTMQDALTALNPALTVGEQITEVLLAHDTDVRSHRYPAKHARERAIEMLGLVGLPDPARRLRDYPHQFSGGMRQRIMIACALACRPRLLIADEPTTALDVTVQAQVLDLIAEMRARLGMSVVLISHDLGIVAEHCDRVAVMYAGQIVETGRTAEVIARPRHPYTKGLLRSIPRLADPEYRINPIPGQIPEPINMPPGCRFLPRCEGAVPACRAPVSLRPDGIGREARCIRTEALA
jgi:oligopeptide/dipeptide ABC transporter ATP-binding protein